MKLLSFTYENKNLIGVQKGENVHPINNCTNMNELIVNQIKPEYDSTIFYKLEDIKINAPIINPLQDIICLGLNYKDHVEESSRFDGKTYDAQKGNAVYFSKRCGEAVGNHDFIDGHFDILNDLDYECELALIISKDAKNVKRESVFDYVFGYTIINDISARTIQKNHNQWYFGKSLDTFVPMGPCILTADEIQNPPQLDIKSYVNGELRQNSNTRELIFSIEDIITELSRGMTLKAGTIIATGTPAGAGMGFTPPKFLKENDEVTCEIELIGKLTNIIK